MSKEIIKNKPPKTSNLILKRYYKKALKVICDERKVNKFLKKLEIKLLSIPKLGEKLSYAPILASLLNSWFHKSYNAPLGIIIAILAALMYFVNPFDIISDVIPVLGLADDGFVFMLCLPLIKSDIDEYLEWRENNEKTGIV